MKFGIKITYGYGVEPSSSRLLELTRQDWEARNIGIVRGVLEKNMLISYIIFFEYCTK